MYTKTNRYREQWNNHVDDNFKSEMPLVLYRVTWKNDEDKYFEFWTESYDLASKKKYEIDHSKGMLIYLNFESWKAYRSDVHDERFGYDGRKFGWWEKNLENKILDKTSDKNLIIFCADIGRFSEIDTENNFGWASSTRQGSSDIYEFCKEISSNIKQEKKICIGFECPLWLPLRSNPSELTKAREIEGNRAWSAGAGPYVTTTGLVQTAWIFREIKNLLPNHDLTAYFDWHDFTQAKDGIFIWEALVSGDAHSESHVKDAETAVNAFSRYLKKGYLRGENGNSKDGAISLIQIGLELANWKIYNSNSQKIAKVIKADEKDKQEF